MRRVSEVATQPRRVTPLAVVISSVLGASMAAEAQQAPGPGLDEVIVTAQKRSENLQAVPISIQALDTKKLAELQVASFDDYARYLPSLSIQSYGPGQSQLYVRGVSNGGDGLHLGSQPLVGLYLDEMPVTTISNNLDVHVYDMARVEALSGPQGTLFGASSMAGTMRLITNKPDPAKFEAGYDVTGEAFTKGDVGAKVEGFVNLPINDKTAIRLVGWSEHDGGYINNVRGSSQYFPTSGVRRDNADLVEKNSNPVDTFGGRIALRFNLNDNWTITPTLQSQSQTAYGQTAYTPFAVTVTPTDSEGNPLPPMTLGGTGDLNISRYFKEINRDTWTMGTLTIEGKIADFGVTYAGGYIKRDVHNVSDYSDYALFYDALYAYNPAYYGDHYVDKNGNPISPLQSTVGVNHFTKFSHELRISLPETWKVHGVFGLFLQRQSDQLRYDYYAPLLAPVQSVSGSPGTVYLDSSHREDRDHAAFTDLTYDVTDKLALTGGIRLFHYDNTVLGFSGFGAAFPTADAPYGGENICQTPIDPTNHDHPCYNIVSRATKSSETHRLNVTYKFTDDRMVYGTWSTGFRPGGINRLPQVPPYNPDYLTNFEIGTKTMWFDHRLRINAAVFLERWKDAQFGYSGPNAVTVVSNAGKAEIRGLEADIHWRVSDGLTVSSSFTLLDAKLKANVCHFLSAKGDCSEPNPDTGAANEVYAPTGTRLPVSSKIKGNTIVRYEWTQGEFRNHAQLAAVYQSNVRSNLRTDEFARVGTQPGYGTIDLALGTAKNEWTAEIYVQNALDRRGEAYRYTGCVPSVCSLIDVIPIKPRLIGVSFGRRY
jgi:outer membrane receptor protein involved in Fe transport